MGGSSVDDVIFGTIGYDNIDPLNGVLVYDWDNSSTLYSETWPGVISSIHPAAGELAGTKMIGYPFGNYNPASENPAALLEPSTSTETDCKEGNEEAASLYFGVFADWTATSGADAFVLPSEMECLAWDEYGDPITGWPTGEYEGALYGSSISPTALGKLYNSTYADVLFCSKGILYAYNSDGDELDDLDFPITLPDGLNAVGGFAIGDIDRDSKVEIVFGTTDGYLHCWELGSGTTGYAPWPQFQHDAGRTGVLE